MFLSLFPIPLQLECQEVCRQKVGRSLGMQPPILVLTWEEATTYVAWGSTGQLDWEFPIISYALLFCFLLSCFRDGVTQNKSQAKAFLCGGPHTHFHSIFCNAFCRPFTMVCFFSLMLLFEGIKCFQSYPYMDIHIHICRLFLLARLKLIGYLPVGILLLFYMNIIFIIDYKFKSHSWCYCEVALQAQEFVVKLRKNNVFGKMSYSKNKNMAETGIL